MQIEKLVRYPVKGLGPEFVPATQLATGGPMPFDRTYAIAHAATEFDPASPVYLEKHHFLMLMRDPKLAALKTAFDESQQRINIALPDGRTVGCRLDDPDDHQAFVDVLFDYMGNACRGGPPRIVSASDHRFFDMPQDYLSLINLASVSDLGDTIGTELDPIRFRANIYVSGLPAWEEKALVGRELVCGDVRLRVAAEIQRCAATSVNPDNGETDVNVPFSLRKHYDTLDMGLYLEVLEGGTIETGTPLVPER